MSQNPFNTENLQQWAARRNGTVTCREQRCEGRVEFSNDLLHALHLAPLTRFEAEIVVVDNRAMQSAQSLSDVQYSGAQPSGASTQVVIEYEPSKSFDFPIGDAFVGRGPRGKLPSILYAVTPQSSPRAKAIAFELNSWCLVRIGGCSQSQQAPSIWSLPSTQVTSNSGDKQ